ncbi:MAG TPA: DUF4230 domain-containing protein [Acidimicrobiales bacterium]|jgi:hypothetical protein|nr:DUF4230 domain-containing protein [Acidimicrobiales bacterium]
MIGRREQTVVVRQRSRVGTAIVGALVVMALIAGAGSLGLGRLLPSLPNPFSTKTVDRTQPALLKSLEDLSRYQAATANFQVIVDTEKDAKFLPSIIKGERTVFVAAGSVDASVDFSQLDERSITVSEDRRTATIVLPEPTVSPPTVDPEQSRVASRDRGLLDRIGSVFSDSPTSEQPLYVAAQAKMQQAADQSDLRKRAEDNTRSMLQGMLRSLGFTSVTVSFSPTPA